MAIMTYAVRRAFKTLGVSEGSSLDECKKTYRRLSVIHHPDRGGDAEEFHKVSEAYDTIKAWYSGDTDKLLKAEKNSNIGSAVRRGGSQRKHCVHVDLMHFTVR